MTSQSIKLFGITLSLAFRELGVFQDAIFSTEKELVKEYACRNNGRLYKALFGEAEIDKKSLLTEYCEVDSKPIFDSKRADRVKWDFIRLAAIYCSNPTPKTYHHSGPLKPIDQVEISDMINNFFRGFPNCSNLSDKETLAKFNSSLTVYLQIIFPDTSITGEWSFELPELAMDRAYMLSNAVFFSFMFCTRDYCRFEDLDETEELTDGSRNISVQSAHPFAYVYNKRCSNLQSGEFLKAFSSAFVDLYANFYPDVFDPRKIIPSKNMDFSDTDFWIAYLYSFGCGSSELDLALSKLMVDFCREDGEKFGFRFDSVVTKLRAIFKNLPKNEQDLMLHTFSNGFRRHCQNSIINPERKDISAVAASFAAKKFMR